jgi:hypothetical protein
LSFVYGTNVELLYSMPAIGATLAATAVTCVSGTSSSAAPFLMPSLQNIWSPSQMQGKSLMIVANGGYDVGSNTGNKMSLILDSALATTAASSVTVASTGSNTFPTSTTGAWEIQLWMSCVSTGTVSTWYPGGTMTCGPGSSNVTASSTFVWGSTITAGIPQVVTIPTTVPYYVDLYSQWATAPTAFVVSTFQVYAMN